MAWASLHAASVAGGVAVGVLPDGVDGTAAARSVGPHCLAAFKQEARRILLRHEGRPQGWSQTIETEDGLRRILLTFIADFADEGVVPDSAYMKGSRALVKAAHDEQVPLVVDPFTRNGGAQVGKSSYDPAATGLGRPADRLGAAALDILFGQGQDDEATRPPLQQEMMHRETG